MSVMYTCSTGGFVHRQTKTSRILTGSSFKIRRNVEGMKKGEVINLSDKMQHLLPATQIHVDTAASSVAYRVEKELGQHADVLFQGRVQVIK